MTGKIIYDNLNFTGYGPKGITTVHESVRIRYPFFVERGEIYVFND